MRPIKLGNSTATYCGKKGILMPQWPEGPTSLNEEFLVFTREAKENEDTQTKYSPTNNNQERNCIGIQSPSKWMEAHAISNIEENAMAAATKNRIAQLHQFTPNWERKTQQSKGFARTKQSFANHSSRLGGGGGGGGELFWIAIVIPSTTSTSEDYSGEYLDTNHTILISPINRVRLELMPYLGNGRNPYASYNSRHEN